MQELIYHLDFKEILVKLKLKKINKIYMVLKFYEKSKKKNIFSKLKKKKILLKLIESPNYYLSNLVVHINIIFSFNKYLPELQK